MKEKNVGIGINGRMGAGSWEYRKKGRELGQTRKVPGRKGYVN